MKSVTEQYLDFLAMGRVLPDVNSIEDIDAALALRHAPEFETPWLRIRRRLDTMSGRQPPDPMTARRIDRAREQAFKSSFESSASDEFSALVSDDVELIAQSLEYGVEDEWLNGFAHEYSMRRFPTGTIVPMSGRLSSALSIAQRTS